MRIRARFEFKLSDCWIGVFWRWDSIRSVPGGSVIPLITNRREVLDFWLCLIPCVPLHITIDRRQHQQYASADFFSVPLAEPWHPSDPEPEGGA